MRCLTLALALLAGPALAQDTDLELVLLADASGSITANELMFQREGYAQAMTDPEVLAVIGNTAYGHIAVTYVEWAANQGQVVKWMRIANREDAAVFADSLLTSPRMAFGRNAIGRALLTGKALIERNDLDGWRRVIDFSGDSAGNFSGPGIEQARDAVVASGITINALPILRDAGRYPGLAQTYKDRVIGGNGAFVVAAHSRADFAEAVKRKLILEISGTMPGQQVVTRR
ncbi:hypothetical protein AL036_14940 [Salipiger aestuarii]|uniref:DUF1194 domain-containing protein n=1 Tax=Salipiger aestuarii TaxID=568098 RepID=UPI00025B836E|nr:DUF1194 domain-containing protein [Salipiger aestuarii]EIE52018.1 hypothetical protein C357_06052 [Citreicella sp. 357]KAA8606370.1 hypothetical protein AL036_14940 [Salipiger aestuarii]